MNTAERLPDLNQISVIVPVKNEEASIRQLLQGLSAQTCQPAEIVITDGGSTDRTKELIREHRLSSPISIVLVETEGALPGRGRNLAIAHASHEWIASIDAGIRPQPDWLAQLVAAARREPDAEVVYGVAEPLRDTYFTECAAITYVPAGRLTQVIPSCLLRRSAWVKAGGFREDLRSSEDLLFFKRLDAAGVRTTKCHDAVVAWELRPTLATTFRRFKVYSRNGMRAGLVREWQYNVTRLYLLMLILLLAALWFWPLLLVPPAILLLRAEKRIRGWYRAQCPQRVWREMLNPRRILTVACINVVIDIATFCGMWQWLVHDRLVPRKESRDHSSSV
ncbi:MAG: glycosyltransferase [Pyrinomonadaceae bacterium]